MRVPRDDQEGRAGPADERRRSGASSSTPDDAKPWPRPIASGISEDLRLLYVALTRARHALWVGVALRRRHGGRALPLPPQRARLSAGRHGTRGRRRDPAVAATQRRRRPAPRSPWWPADVRRRTAASQSVRRGAASAMRPSTRPRFERDWSIGSFSALVRDLSRSPVTQVPADPALQEELLVAPATSRRCRPVARRAAAPLPARRAARQLPARPARVAGRCSASRWRPTSICATACGGAANGRAGAIAPTTSSTWLSEVVTTPLPPLGRIARCARRRRCPRWSSGSRAKGSPPAASMRLCSEHLLGGRTGPPLPASARLNGMVMGFADLVFEHDGRYWVLDYKSNALGLDDAAYDARRARGRDGRASLRRAGGVVPARTASPAALAPRCRLSARRATWAARSTCSCAACAGPSAAATWSRRRQRCWKRCDVALGTAAEVARCRGRAVPPADPAQGTLFPVAEGDAGAGDRTPRRVATARDACRLGRARLAAPARRRARPLHRRRERRRRRRRRCSPSR